MDANSFLMGGGGAPTAKFPTPGTTVGGQITEPPTLEQQRDIKTGEKKFWKDGDPMMQLVVTVQTDQRDSSIEDDDGRRRIFIKGQMKNAVADAVRTAGSKGLEIGGTLWVRFTHELPPTGVGMSPPKQYEAKYVTAANAQLGVGGQAPAPAAPAPAAAPAQYAAPAAPPQYQAPAPAAAPPGVNPVTGEITGTHTQHAPTAQPGGEPPF
ncbi:hypothetical protein ACQEV4_40295 [Streptomyces shenzhenensis]|uniref:hypothetical protein n=1 Tax=Streptomyces shenzhenensis TaxID=943815 RepID=UPI003D8BB9FC